MGFKNKVLLIDDEQLWVKKLSAIILEYCPSDICVFSNYDDAEYFLNSDKLTDYNAVIIDIKLREHIYDQGGLALLNLVKQSYPQIPVLMLTAYAYDYPGIRDITSRYQRVFTYDKETFTQNSKDILELLFFERIAFFRTTTSNWRYRLCKESSFQRIVTNIDKKHQAQDVILGAKIIILIIASAISVFLLFQTFSEYTAQINVIFSMVIFTLICVLLQVFKPSIVREAWKLFQTILKEK